MLIRDGMQYSTMECSELSTESSSGQRVAPGSLITEAEKSVKGSLVPNPHPLPCTPEKVWNARNSWSFSPFLFRVPHPLTPLTHTQLSITIFVFVFKSHRDTNARTRHLRLYWEREEHWTLGGAKSSGARILVTVVCLQTTARQSTHRPILPIYLANRVSCRKGGRLFSWDMYPQTTISIVVPPAVLGRELRKMLFFRGWRRKGDAPEDTANSVWRVAASASQHRA